MHDDMEFEARLAEAFGRYADGAPAMDDATLIRVAVEGRGRRRSTSRPAGPWQGWTVPSPRVAGRPGFRPAYLLLVPALLLATLLAALAGGALRSDLARPLGRNGAIVYEVQGRNHSGGGIHVIGADGLGDHLVDSGRCPRYSADGTVLAAVVYDGSAFLQVANAENWPRRVLVDEPPTEVEYALSPDGSQVAWFRPVRAVERRNPDGTTSAYGWDAELWVAPLGGFPGIRIVPRAGIPNAYRGLPTWSPRGDRLAFATYAADLETGATLRTGIYVVGADGSDLRLLTSRPAQGADGISWSPDGRHVAFVGLPDGTPISMSDSVPPAPGDVFVIGADGAGERNITQSTGSETAPEWAPDGERMGFMTSEGSDIPARVATIPMDGPAPAGPVALGPVSEWFVWAPDASQLLLDPLSLVDRDFRMPAVTLQVVDGLVFCKPSWQWLAP